MKTKATLLIAVLAATPLFGANVVQNGSFELPEVGSSACFTFSNPPFPLCSVPNWTGSFAVDGDQSGGTVSGPPPSPIPAIPIPAAPVAVLMDHHRLGVHR